MDKKDIIYWQERVRNGISGVEINYYIDSPELKKIYNDSAGELEVIFEDQINEVYNVSISPDGILIFTVYIVSGYSYDTPSFGYDGDTTLKGIISELDNYFGEEISSVLSGDSINELIVVGSIGDSGMFADDADFLFVDIHYTRENGFVNNTYFQRYLQYDDTRIEFDYLNDIKLLTYSTKFTGNQGFLTLRGIELIEVFSTWLKWGIEILQIDTKGIPSTVVLSFGVTFTGETFNLGPNSIQANSAITEIYIDSNIELSNNFIDLEGNSKIKFFVVESNNQVIELLKSIGYSIELIITDQIPKYVGELVNT
jgi:hypothetical protein